MNIFFYYFLVITLEITILIYYGQNGLLFFTSSLPLLESLNFISFCKELFLPWILVLCIFLNLQNIAVNVLKNQHEFIFAYIFIFSSVLYFFLNFHVFIWDDFSFAWITTFGISCSSHLLLTNSAVFLISEKYLSFSFRKEYFHWV